MRFHTSLPVTDIEQTIAFYRTLFAVEPVKIKPDYAKFLPPDIGLNISFHENPDGAEALRELHLGVEMTTREAFEQAHARLSAAGLIETERETAICCYANQDKFWVADPNGYRWEVYLLLEDTELKIEPQTACCAPSSDSTEASCCWSI